MQYGPEGKCWYYKNKHTYLTTLGKSCKKNGATKMGAGYTGSFKDGQLQLNNTTWSFDASNPETDNETYNSDNWKSTTAGKASAIMQDWKNKTGADSIDSYMEKGKYCIAKGTSYSDSEKSQSIKTRWKQVTGAIVTDSWKAIYAKTDKEYNAIVAKMIKDTNGYGYDQCINFCKKDAAKRKALEDALKN
jgi:putative aldouronate transport system substrate-binding protein